MLMSVREELFSLCNTTERNLGRIEKYISEHSMSTEDVTYVAAKIVGDCAFEKSDFEYENHRKPKSSELVSTDLDRLFEIFFAHGLNPNAVFEEGVGLCYNVMGGLFFFDNFSVALQILKRCLEFGGNPNLMIVGETLFERVDFDVFFGAIEQGNRKKYAMWVRFWLLLIAFGGRLENGNEPIKMKSGLSIEIFKDYDLFSFELDFSKDGCKIHIFSKDSGEEVAVAE